MAFGREIHNPIEQATQKGETKKTHKPTQIHRNIYVVKLGGKGISERMTDRNIYECAI